MAIRSQADIVRDMQAWLETRLRVVDSGSDTVVYALLLQAIAAVLAQCYTDLEGAETAQGIGDPDAVDQFDLDDIAYNLNITRKPPASATGFATFRRGDAPDVNIQIGAEDGSGGIIVGSVRDANGASVTFQTTSTVFFTPTSTQDPTTGFYEVSAPIVAVQPGTSGNRDAGTIQTLVTPVQGVTSVTNKIATTNGKDVEENTDLAVRMAAKILGFQPGILEGLRTIAIAQAGVQDATVVGPDDSEFQRSLIGAVDLVIKGSSPTLTVDQFTYSGPTAVILSRRPVLDISTVVSTVGLTFGALTEGAQWQYAQDTTSESRLSTSSNDQLQWLGSEIPNTGAQTVVTYSYDALIASIQDVVDDDDKHFPAASVLVKSGTSVLVDIAFTIVRNGTVDSTTLSNNIATALSTYIASLGLGSLIRQSALVPVIKSVSGIRQLVVPFTTLAERGSVGVDDIQLTKYEYPTLDAQSISITFSN